MSARLLSFVVWALAAASAVYWASRLLVRPTPVPPQALTAQATPAAAGSLTRLFGAVAPEPVSAPTPVVVESRFKLLGVVAARAGQRSGVALISMDDKPARALAIGARVDGEWVVQGIAHRQVELGPRGGAAALTLTLPVVAEAARGVPAAGASPTTVPTPMPQEDQKRVQERRSQPPV